MQEIACKVTFILLVNVRVFMKIQYYKKLFQLLNDITAVTELLFVRKPKC